MVIKMRGAYQLIREEKFIHADAYITLTFVMGVAMPTEITLVCLDDDDASEILRDWQFSWSGHTDMPTRFYDTVNQTFSVPQTNHEHSLLERMTFKWSGIGRYMQE